MNYKKATQDFLPHVPSRVKFELAHSKKKKLFLTLASRRCLLSLERLALSIGSSIISRCLRFDKFGISSFP